MSTPNPWLTTLQDWPGAAIKLLQARDACVVRVVVAQVRGSAPREAGATMLVASSRVIGTIGGGQLEWQALAAARTLLSESEVAARLQRLVLGTDLAQCCGGVVELWIERFVRTDLPLLAAAQAAAGVGPVVLRSTLAPAGMERTMVRSMTGNGAEAALLSASTQLPAPRLIRTGSGAITLLERLDCALPPLWLYGVGYVGQALARILLELPLRLTWIDARRHLFPSSLPASVTVCSDDPLESVARAPAGAHFLIMTHSHVLDYALTRALLERNEFASLGLIGSQSKSARFRSRLKRDGVTAERLARLTCPIGISGISSKWPAAIAVAVAAELLQRLGQSAAAGFTESTDCGSDCGRCQAGAPGAR
jgi:xanthine dehydrogenase accessory factor